MVAQRMSDLEARVKRLERSNRWLKGGALTVMAVALLAVNRGQGSVGVVEAHGFVLVDARGEAVGD